MYKRDDSEVSPVSITLPISIEQIRLTEETLMLRSPELNLRKNLDGRESVRIIVAASRDTVTLVDILAFIRFALGIDFGNRTGLIIFTTIVGGTMGLSFGYFFASITKKSVEFKNNMVIGISMICSFLAGMMSNEVQYFVKQHAYIIDRINPVNLITESYYKLYYYTDLSKYYENIIILIIMTVLFAIGTITVLTVQDKKMMRESRG